MLRGQVREFVQNEIDSFKQFLVLGNLLDYVGGELVTRTGKESVQDRLLLDLNKAIPSRGSLTGMGGYFEQAGNFKVKVLRPVGDDLVVIWESDLINVEVPGVKRVEFPVQVGVEPGDLIGYYFPQLVIAAYDDGTGNARYVAGDIRLGDTVRTNSLAGARDSRAYSLGVYGLLE